MMSTDHLCVRPALMTIDLKFVLSILGLTEISNRDAIIYLYKTRFCFQELTYDSCACKDDCQWAR